jgi:opacity protein-like surface antigen
MKNLLLAVAVSFVSLAGGARAADPKPATATPRPAEATASADANKAGKPGDAALPWEARKDEPKAGEDRPADERTGSGGLHDCGSSLSMKGQR